MKNFYLVALMLTMLGGISASYAQEGYIGEIRMFAGNFAPYGWSLCDGQILPISQNTALFSLIGTYYGGDGETTFALPDLRGRVAIHAGNGPGLSPRNNGQKGGNESIVLTEGNLPSHSHSVAVKGSTDPGSTNVATGNYPADTSTLDKEYAPNGDTTMYTATTTTTGNNVAVPTMQPYLVIRYIICRQGIYPSQN